ncbi:MAG: type II toxin-antitoxin system Phd/YefM family antitoxin [Thermoplasmatota archaeon]
MTIIRPISDLRNDFSEISELCHQNDEPVYITRNGRGDLVVMSLAHYERMEALIDLYEKLGAAEMQSSEKTRRLSHDQVMKKLRERAHE